MKTQDEFLESMRSALLYLKQERLLELHPEKYFGPRPKREAVLRGDLNTPPPYGARKINQYGFETQNRW